MNAYLGLKSARARAAPGSFPPELVVEIKAIACELPATRGLPLSRFSSADIVREAQRCGIVARISEATVWRWLHEDAIRPWQHRSWIFPLDSVKQEVRLNDNHLGRLVGDDCRRLNGSCRGSGEWGFTVKAA